MDYKLYSIPLIAAFIGWLTNYVAIKMLFRPKKPINFLGLKIQGVFPKRQNALAKKLGKIVASELLSEQDLKNAIEKSTSHAELGALLDNKITKIITEKLPSAIPALGLFLNQELISLVKLTILNELEDLMKNLTTSLGTKIYAKIDIEQLVEDKVKAFSSEKMEELILSVMKKELRFVEEIGAVLGFVIGLVQVLIAS